jgi:hypothetical protein
MNIVAFPLPAENLTSILRMVPLGGRAVVPRGGDDVRGPRGAVLSAHFDPTPVLSPLELASAR